jgi:hypothetical protein
MWARAPASSGGGGGAGSASPPPPRATALQPRAPSSLVPSDSLAGGGSPPAGASPRGSSPTRLRRRSTAAATFAETLLQATATFRGLADEVDAKAAATAEGASPRGNGLGGSHPHPHPHAPRPPPPPPPPAAPVLSLESERALGALVAAATKEGSQSSRTLRWRPRWRLQPPVIAPRPRPPAVPALKPPDAMVL